MIEIRLRLDHSASLGGLAAPAGGGAAALPAGMGAVPSIYLILNTATNTRYAGISSNLVGRFKGRMAVVNELGLSTANMNPIWAWWGTANTRIITLARIYNF
jgi:hypothetical protein